MGVVVDPADDVGGGLRRRHVGPGRQRLRPRDQEDRELNASGSPNCKPDSAASAAGDLASNGREPIEAAVASAVRRFIGIVAPSGTGDRGIGPRKALSAVIALRSFSNARTSIWRTRSR